MPRSKKIRLNRKKKIFRRKRVIPKVIKRYVKSQIHSNIENKEYCSYANNTSITNSGATGGFNYLALIPDISQGTTEQTRIGNQVKPVSLNLRMNIQNKVYNATTNPSYHNTYRVLIISFRKQNAFTTADITNNLFNVGSSSVGWQGTLLDAMLPVNTTIFKVHYDRVVSLSSPVDANVNDARPFQKSLSFYLKNCLPKTIKYNDAVGTPTNCNLYMIMTAVASDGSTGSVSATAMGSFSYVSRFIYEDA